MKDFACAIQDSSKRSVERKNESEGCALGVMGMSRIVKSCKQACSWVAGGLKLPEPLKLSGLRQRFVSPPPILVSQPFGMFRVRSTESLAGSNLPVLRLAPATV